MTDFAIFFEGSWRDGQPAADTHATYVVWYDQKHTAYRVARRDYDDFIEWVAVQWETSDLRDVENDETASDYLDRIGVQVYEA